MNANEEEGTWFSEESSLRNKEDYQACFQVK